MPGRDGTGPMAKGTMRGRGMGYCYSGGKSGRGYRQGIGMGSGNGCRRANGQFDNDVALMDQEMTKNVLENRKSILEKQLTHIKNALLSLEKTNQE